MAADRSNRHPHFENNRFISFKVTFPAMFAALLALCASLGNDVSKRDVSRAVRKELGRMYMMQAFLGQYAPFFMMFGDANPFMFNGMMNMPFNKMPFAQSFNEEDDENADDENIHRKDVQRAVRKELQRMYMMTYMLQNLPQGDRGFQFPFGAQDGKINPLMFPFVFGGFGGKNQQDTVNEDYDDYANDYDYDYDYDDNTYDEDDYYE